jgi:tRNA (cytidine/uridine-2'-O-)-methyltransferase
MKIVLYQPEIPQNTGNIVRTCSATGCDLILVRPLGFSTSNRMLKRAGLDYWEGVNVSEIDDLMHYLENYQGSFFFFSSKAERFHTDVSYTDDSLLIFGSERRGLDPTFWERWPEKFVKIPMKKDARCLNLANSAAVGVYEAKRQLEFRFVEA